MPAASFSYHYHRCRICKKVWAHDPDGDGLRDKTFDQMHVCCGTDERARAKPTPEERAAADAEYEAEMRRTAVPMTKRASHRFVWGSVHTILRVLLRSQVESTIEQIPEGDQARIREACEEVMFYVEKKSGHRV